MFPDFRHQNSEQRTELIHAQGKCNSGNIDVMWQLKFSTEKDKNAQSVPGA